MSGARFCLRNAILAVSLLVLGVAEVAAIAPHQHAVIALHHHNPAGTEEQVLKVAKLEAEKEKAEKQEEAWKERAGEMREKARQQAELVKSLKKELKEAKKGDVMQYPLKYYLDETSDDMNWGLSEAECHSRGRNSCRSSCAKMASVLKRIVPLIKSSKAPPVTPFSGCIVPLEWRHPAGICKHPAVSGGKCKKGWHCKTCRKGADNKSDCLSCESGYVLGDSDGAFEIDCTGVCKAVVYDPMAVPRSALPESPAYQQPKRPAALQYPKKGEQAPGVTQIYTIADYCLLLPLSAFLHLDLYHHTGRVVLWKMERMDGCGSNSEYQLLTWALAHHMGWIYGGELPNTLHTTAKPDFVFMQSDCACMNRFLGLPKTLHNRIKNGDK
jgi:hypothetical protein